VPGNGTTTTLGPTSGRKQLPLWLLGLIALADVSGFGLMNAAGIGVLLFFLCAGVLLAVDWRGFLTLNGVIKWSRMKWWQAGLLGWLFFGLIELSIAIYVVQQVSTYPATRRQARLQQRLRTAQLEADVGILPPTDGTCESCGKPAQIGADFCAYCGRPLRPRPRICSACATVAAPDAAFCPRCGTRLASTTAGAFVERE
jgi:Double zinc ribbon